MFVRETGYPKLRGKGYELKNFGRALLCAWEHFMKPHIIIHQQILLMLKMNVKMEDLLSENKLLWVLPAAAAWEFQESARAMLLVYNAVARHFAESLVHAGLEFFGQDTYLRMWFHLICRIVCACLNPPREGLQLFDITSKFHLLQHITDYADCVSPPPCASTSVGSTALCF